MNYTHARTHARTHTHTHTHIHKLEFLHGHGQYVVDVGLKLVQVVDGFLQLSQLPYNNSLEEKKSRQSNLNNTGSLFTYWQA